MRTASIPNRSGSSSTVLTARRMTPSDGNSRVVTRYSKCLRAVEDFIVHMRLALVVANEADASFVPVIKICSGHLAERLTERLNNLRVNLRLVDVVALFF